MQQPEKEDFDYFLIQMEREFNGAYQKEDKNMTEHNLELGFCIWLPEKFIVENNEATDVFWSKKRPKVIYINAEENAGVTFQTIEMQTIVKGEGNEEHSGRESCLVEYRKRLREAIKRKDDRTVFYNMGEINKITKVYWMEYKSFASDERVYNLVFLFHAEKKYVLGTFYCLFADYEKWKKIILGVLGEIQIREY